jgi:hypothetical protein
MVRRQMASAIEVAMMYTCCDCCDRVLLVLRMAVAVFMFRATMIAPRMA